MATRFIKKNGKITPAGGGSSYNLSSVLAVNAKYGVTVDGKGGRKDSPNGPKLPGMKASKGK